MRILIFLTFFICILSCQTPSDWHIDDKYYEIIDGLNNRILTKWDVKSPFSEIYSTVREHVNDKSFLIVYQKPKYENYIRDLSSFLNIRFNAYKNNYKSKTDYKKVYWENYSDSINEKTIESHNVNTKNWTIEYQQLLYSIADSLMQNNNFHKKVLSNKENFWIIDLKTDSLMGPYQKQEYLDQKIKLGISKELKLYAE